MRCDDDGNRRLFLDYLFDYYGWFLGVPFLVGGEKIIEILGHLDSGLWLLHLLLDYDLLYLLHLHLHLHHFFLHYFLRRLLRRGPQHHQRWCLAQTTLRHRVGIYNADRAASRRLSNRGLLVRLILDGLSFAFAQMSLGPYNILFK